jgi:hypothetical protein
VRYDQRVRGRTALLGLAVLAAIGAAVGSAGPWAWIESVAYDGTAARSGRVTLAAALLALILLAAALWTRAAWLAALAAVPAAAAVIVAGYHASDPDRFVGSSLNGLAQVGWGAVLTIVSGAALVAISLASAWLVRQPR